MVELRAITKDNLNEVLRLNISEQQKTIYLVEISDR